jgi:hypothetical protein
MTVRQLAVRASASLLFVLVGCASLPEWSGVAADSPAEPRAAAAVYTPPPNPFASAIKPISGAAENEHSQDGTVMYTCPMHPEVRADAPGACPKCGMALTPLAPATKHGDHDGGAL